ncbi:hypothetical protein QOZ75_29605, partial [Pseudomonas aeruginosa]|uniref:hypothetical protein n=1 Tax=Pseudomonas aeruginosa TaxID=287 RepID=UPI003459B496
QPTHLDPDLASRGPEVASGRAYGHQGQHGGGRDPNVSSGEQIEDPPGTGHGWWGLRANRIRPRIDAQRAEQDAELFQQGTAPPADL